MAYLVCFYLKIIFSLLIKNSLNSIFIIFNGVICGFFEFLGGFEFDPSWHRDGVR